MPHEAATINTVTDELTALWNAFSEDHQTFIEKGNKSAGARARKSLMSIKKLCSTYKALNLEKARSK